MPAAEGPGHRVPLLVHVGYHKTGTTYLQSGLFRDPRTGFTSPWPSSLIRDCLVLTSDLTFVPCQVQKRLEPGLQAAHQEALVPVLSDERLSGSPHAGGYDSAPIAVRLARTFKAARVLIVIREQASALDSVYRQFVRDGGASRLERYLAPRNPAEVPQFRFEHYEYHHLIAKFISEFSQDQVLVLPFECLVRDEAAFLARIAHFAGLSLADPPPRGERYPALGAATLAAKRRFNWLFVRNALNPSAPFYVKDHEARFTRLDRWLPKLFDARLERRMRRHIEGQVGDRYAASNRETSRLTGLDLEALGYRV